MLKNFKNLVKKKIEIFLLIFLIFITTISTTFFNYKKNTASQSYENFLNNIYLKKTLNQIVNNLEPKYVKIDHKIKSGETFDKILNSYSISKKEIIIIKKNLKKKLI